MKRFFVFMMLCLMAGKAVRAQKNEPATIFKADLDITFDSGSNINAIPLDARRIKDLSVLGMVWGYVKYYHPALNKGEYNWDYELFRVLPKILECKNEKQRNDTLDAWIRQLGSFETGKREKRDSADIKLKPDLNWIEDVAVLGEQLSQRLLEMKTAKRDFRGYYAGYERGGNPDLKNEKPYAAKRYPDVGFRLLALYRYWNIIQYFFPYKYLIEEDWKNVLPEFIPQFVNAGNELEYKRSALALIARIHDTHASIYSNEPVFEKMYGKYYVPLYVRFVEEKLVVAGYSNELLGPETGLIKGDIITSINGKNIDNIIKEYLPFTSASNYPTALRNMAGNLLRSNDTTLTVTYLRENKVNTARLSTFSRQMVSLNVKVKDTCFKYVTPDIAYINPGYIKKEYIPKVMPDFMKTKGIIIDHRYYPADAMYPALAKYLMPERAKFVKMTLADTKIPGTFVYLKEMLVGEKNKDHFKGKVVILVNEKTQSAAEFSTMALRVTPGAVVIGSTTAGADGNVSLFYLPGGIRTAISGIGVYYPDKRETQRVGIVPDITFHPTVKGIAAGRDELLEKAIAIINGK